PTIAESSSPLRIRRLGVPQLLRATTRNTGLPALQWSRSGSARTEVSRQDLAVVAVLCSALLLPLATRWGRATLGLLGLVSGLLAWAAGVELSALLAAAAVVAVGRFAGS